MSSTSLRAIGFDTVMKRPYPFESYKYGRDPLEYWNMADTWRVEGINLNQVNSWSGYAPLHEAVNNLMVDDVQWLLANGADPHLEAPEHFYITPIQLARSIPEFNSRTDDPKIFERQFKLKKKIFSMLQQAVEKPCNEDRQERVDDHDSQQSRRLYKLKRIIRRRTKVVVLKKKRKKRR